MKKPLPFLVYTCLIIVFIFIAVNLDSTLISNFDLTIILFVQGLETSALTKILTFFTVIGSVSGIAIIGSIVVILLFFFYKERKRAILFAVTMIGTGVLNLLLKLYFQRDRPEIYRLADASGYSFPSGHAMGAFSLYIILTYLLWPHMKAKKSHVMLSFFTFFMIGTIAISRIYLGVHYPSDIVGGFVMSALWLTFTLSTFHHFYARADLKWRT